MGTRQTGMVAVVKIGMVVGMRVGMRVGMVVVPGLPAVPVPVEVEVVVV